MQWHLDAHPTATALLDLPERAILRDLHDDMWLQKGWLPDDDKRIAPLLRIKCELVAGAASSMAE